MLFTLASVACAQDLTADQKRRAESLMSIWENSQINKAYGYAENIGDGRGVTFGWVGFTTADGDAIGIFNEFESRHPNNPLSPFMDQVLAKNVTDEAGFIQAVHDSDAGEFQADFEAAQDYQSGIEYYAPAQQLARDNGLQTAAGLAELYDSEINHGNDGVRAMVNQTNSDMGGSPASGIDEVQWLDHYLDIRYTILAADPTWKTSTDRATVFKSTIVDGGNLNLDGPIHIDSPQYGSYDIP
jgi:chitosanase